MGDSKSERKDPKEWREEEYRRVSERREAAHRLKTKAETDARPRNLTGLSLSGGGIRSALFNDGFLQGLSHRGFLRYVDYLCSVSGGGYIAGHLVAQNDRDAKDPFHDDKRRWQLGRHPVTGRVDDERLSGIGGYLSRPFEFFPAYLWSFFFSFAFYFGMVGVVATLAALFWRSFDGELFRQMYSTVLGLHLIGNELLIAFIPASLLLIITIFFEILISLYRLSTGYDEPKSRSIHVSTRATLMLALVFATLTSLAIFLGNGKSFVGEDEGTALYLNRYAQIFAIVAACVQVLVFLGRDRLFRSERAEAKQWQRHLQQSVTAIVILVLVFSMVHWMGRENISGYVQHRDPELVAGDVRDWNQLKDLVSAYEVSHGADGGNRAPADLALEFEVPEHIQPKGSWVGSLAIYRWFFFDLVRSQNLANPPANSELQIEASEIENDAALAIKNRDKREEITRNLNDSWTLSRRVFAASMAYLLQQCDVWFLGEVEEVSGSPREVATTDWTWTTMKLLADKYRRVRSHREVYLSAVNEYLRKPQFTDFLVSSVEPDAPELASYDDPKQVSNQVSDEAEEQSPPADNATDEESQDIGPTPAEGQSSADLQPGKSTDESNVNGAEAERVATDTKSATGAPGRSLALGDLLADFLDSREVDWTGGQRDHLVNALRFLDQVQPASSGENTPASNTKNSIDWASVNRSLLEAMLPSMIQNQGDTSTLIVPVHDQQTRIRYLVFWMILASVGLVGGMGPQRVATVFQFYRKQLSNNFLVKQRRHRVRNDDGSNVEIDEASSERKYPRSDDCFLYDLHTEKDGLPYPLVLAAALEPSSCNGSYRVHATPFVLSPQFSGDFSDPQTIIRTEDLSFSRWSNYPAVEELPENSFIRSHIKRRQITLGDAVTLSGAAVTPLMTGNRWLSVILDFFNTGIGQRIHCVNRSKGKEDKFNRRHVYGTLAFCVVVCLCGWILLDLRFSLAPAVLLTVLLCYCVVQKVGSPGLIRSLIDTKEVGSDTGAERNSWYIADGGYHDYLGVTELLRRRCELIVVSDAGANVGNDSLGTLARMCEKASREMGVRFLDLDHEAPIDFGRLELNDDRLVHQPFICMRIRYPESNLPEGLLVYCQMSITDSDPIEIQNIRNLFPSFPDEPTVNQFYNEKQVSAYRALGYHIANRICSELERWPSQGCPESTDKTRDEGGCDKGDPASQKKTDTKSNGDDATRPTDGTWDRLKRFRRCLSGACCATEGMHDGPIEQPLFGILKERLLTSYRLACFEEKSYRRNDIYSEAIWPTAVFDFPTFAGEVANIPGYLNEKDCVRRWLRRYEANADVRSAYRTAVIEDINATDLITDTFCGALWQSLNNRLIAPTKLETSCELFAANLTCIAVAGQEVHRGRPHAAFQVGGRDKLVDLCGRIARAVLTAIDQQPDEYTCDLLQQDLSRITAELVELERSVFQGGEHVSTITFAQCVATTWGRIARLSGRHENLSESIMKEGILRHDGPLGERSFDTGNTVKFPEIAVAEIRDQLNRGLSKLNLSLVRIALAKCWYLGFLSTDEIIGLANGASELDSPQSSPVAHSSRATHGFRHE